MKNFIKNIIRTAFKKKGYNLRLSKVNAGNNEEVLMKQLFDKHNIGLILDIGANHGQYVDSIRKMGYTNKFICFEPVKDAFNDLHFKFESDDKVKAHNCAVGDKNKKITINVSKCDMCSSILDIAKITTDVVADAKYIGAEECNERTLDSFYDEFREQGNLSLKIDTQGFESQVLLGAPKTLKLAKIVFIEMSLVELYKKQVLFSEVVCMLENSGFELFAITPDFLEDSTGRMLAVNGLFVKKERLK